MSEFFTCPRRAEQGMDITSALVHSGPNLDEWMIDSFGTHCSYCGSMHPNFVFTAIEEEKELTPTDKNYKIYLPGSKKFYFQHFDTDQKKRFIELLNIKKIKLAYPGYFYTLPFFLQVVKKD